MSGAFYVACVTAALVVAVALAALSLYGSGYFFGLGLLSAAGSCVNPLDLLQQVKP